MVHFKIIIYKKFISMDHENEALRNKGISSQYGKIYKGTINEAPVKMKVGSIPNKNENIVFRTFS